jgi:hypothetical protein
MAIEKLTTRLKNKTWTNPQIKTHKKSHELRLFTPQTQHKNPARTFCKWALSKHFILYCQSCSSVHILGQLQIDHVEHTEVFRLGLFKSWSCFGFLHLVVCLVCFDITEECTSSIMAGNWIGSGRLQSDWVEENMSVGVFPQRYLRN